MKIQLLTEVNQEELQQALISTGFFTEVQAVQGSGELHPSADIAYISESDVHVNELYEIRAKLPEAIIYYHLTSTKDLELLKQIRQVLYSVDVHLLLPHLAVNDTVDRIVDLFISDDADRANPVVVFAGAISGIGTSSTVHAIAKRVYQMTDADSLKIAVLGLDEWDPGTTVTTYHGSYLDQIKIRLSSRELTSEQLLSSMHKLGYYFLAGNRRLRLQKQYTVDEVSYLIELAKKTFDLILIDGGSHFDNACMLESIKSSSLRYLITTQSAKALQRYRTYREEILFSNFSLLVNLYRPIAELPSSRMVAGEYQLPLVAAIPDIQNFGIIAEHTKKNLVDFEDKEYGLAIDTIVRGIIKKYKLPLKSQLDQETNRKRKFFRIGGN